MDTKRIELKLRELRFDKDSVLIKPDHLSICAADQRYYLGRRKKEILRKKLPMALIHEATGTILHDFSGQFSNGTKAVLVPLGEQSGKNGVKSNYLLDNTFASSGADGFLQDLIVLTATRLIPIEGMYTEIYVFSELVSVALNAINSFEAARQIKGDSFGIWGDGSMGFIVSLVLKSLYPYAKIYVFGKEPRKLLKFSFATRTFYVDQVPSNFSVSHGFECVGSARSEVAIKQMIETLSPQGSINLMGVSEEAITIDTRKIIDKGLQLMGHNRSNASDFREAVRLIRDEVLFQKYLRILISEIIEVKTEDDIYKAFECDVLNDFKTVIKWAI